MTLPPIAVFDLDGTLAETAPDLIASLNVLMRQEGLPEVPLARARDMIGAGARAMIERGFELAKQELTPERSEALFRQFLAIYGENLCVGSHLFPGVAESLDDLAAAGYRLAVCTNKFEQHSRQLLDALGIADRFAAICGRDTFPWYKPDARHLTMTIEVAGGDPSRAVMVGDSRTDIDTAKAAGIPVIAVPFGYTDTPVAELGPDLVIDRFAELVAAIGRLDNHRGLVPAG
ncbi:phosphoglycolate phosphatase [Enterovirga rhinocerotis]|uniref:Phosphoglycolate phosphatase n=1 Tax=Enterovirga rhinocerotis TaxID=1339210 RepID=A0A4R7C5U4_9HYPH|nr:phosphoglycolate phosphatase [Enterovirga rhinocerotis]TDR93768.1 phosphoglycolate phosphatase [Enterovirga rhinocerotis]